MNRPPRIPRAGAAAVIAAAAGLAVAAAPQPASANGCLQPPVWDGATSTYTISTADQLRTLWQGGCDRSATIRLANDIDLTGTGEFAPIGTVGNPFTGTFDGAGHTITGLRIASPVASGFGLFGYSDGAVMRDVRVTGSVSGGQMAEGGLLVGHASGTTVTNVRVSGTVDVVNVGGGMAGRFDGGSITDARSSVAVTSAIAGGLVAIAERGGAPEVGATITNVRTDGSVAGLAGYAGYVGGIVGMLGGVSIARSSSTANVTGANAGGLAGKAQAGLLGGIGIRDSYSVGAVAAAPAPSGRIGGIVGATCDADPIDLERNYFAGTLIGDGNATSGGIVGGSEPCQGAVGAQAITQGNVWDSGTTGPAGSGGTVGAGRTTAQMQDIATYTALGWSIANGWDPAGSSTWGICPQVNGGYPFLQGQTASTACAAPPAPASSNAAAPATLTATLLPSRSGAVSGQTVRIGIRASNPGGTAAQAVTTCMRLPANLVITSAGGATRSGRTACFAMGTLAPGTRATRALTVRVVSTRRITRTVTGSARATGVATAVAAPVALIITPRPARARVTG